MKKFRGLIFLMLTIPSFAQDSTSTELNLPMAPPVKVPAQFIFFDLTWNSWMDAPEGVETKFPSLGFNINLMYEVKIVGHNIALAPGLSYSNATVSHNATFSYSLSSNNDEIVYTHLTPVPDSVEYLGNKFSTSSLDIPVELRFKTNPKEGRKGFWFFSPGFRAGILLSDYHKYRYENIFGDIEKYKAYNIKNVGRFHYGVSLRLGYYKFGLYGYYALSSLFEEDKGPDMKPFSVGITLSPF